MSTTALSIIAKFVTDTEYRSMPSGVIHQAKRIILDTIGCGLAGYVTDTGKIVREVARNLGGNPESTIIVSGDKNSCANTAFVNAKMANALDMDDCFMNLVHFAPMTVFSPLAMSERSGATGRELIEAVILGYEIAARVGLYGGHSFFTGCYTFICHVFGSAVAGAKILGFDAERTMNAISIAAQNAPIPFVGKASESPTSWIKYYDAGLTAWVGIVSCLLAKGGYKGISTLFEGNDGYWNAMRSTKPNYKALTDQLGKKWWIMEAAIKPYPCCRYNHNPIDMFNKIIKEHNIGLEEIESITFRTLPKIADPIRQWAEHDPRDSYGAMFSIPHCIAMAAFKVPIGPQWQSADKINEPEVREFRKKVKLEVDKEAMKKMAEQEEKEFPKEMPISMELSTVNKVYREKGEMSKGDPWKPETAFSDEELKAKFRTNASATLSDEKIERIIEMVYYLDDLDSINELIRQLIR
jgi:2-methylcitrate dehydratase PrpD